MSSDRRHVEQRLAEINGESNAREPSFASWKTQTSDRAREAAEKHFGTAPNTDND